jgi:hypothetical protein
VELGCISEIQPNSGNGHFFQYSLATNQRGEYWIANRILLCLELKLGSAFPVFNY